MKTLYKCFLTVFIFCVTNHSFAQTNKFPPTGAAGMGTTMPNANGANTALSNLATTTAVNVDLLAGTGNTISLGSASNSWKDIYLDGSVYLGGSRFLSYKAGTGTGNTVVGVAVLNANTRGINNTGVGFNSLFSNTKGNYNTANGYQALQFNSIGGSNTATGYKALQNNTTGSGNVANGLYALINNTTGYSNVAIGERALASNTAGYNLVAVGDSALYHQSVNDHSYYSNTAIGSKTLYTNTTGYGNTANGSNALYSNTTGDGNTANGDEALHSNTTGGDNTANGNEALYYDTYGYENTANGFAALFYNIDGYENTANGADALYYNTTGLYNTADGIAALFSNTTGSYTIAIGNAADVNSGNYFSSTALGNEALITADEQVRIGDKLTTSIGGYKAWTNLSDGRVKKNIKANVPGLAFINLLKPIIYNIDLDAADKIIQRPAIKDKDGKTIQPTQENITARQIQQQVVCTGFIAQDVEASAKKIGYDFDGVDAAKNDKDLYGLRYSEFVVPLVKAVQELSQQNDELKNRLAKLEAMMNVQQTNISSAQSSKITTINNASLEQNIPNPFNEATTLNYMLPQSRIGGTSAKIIITDKAGKVLKEVNISANGKGSLKVDACTLSSGAYQYSLYVDGILIDTKQMILAK